ncbi:MAG: hypothetical protein ACK4VV_02055 [Pseudomonas sp.]
MIAPLSSPLPPATSAAASSPRPASEAAPATAQLDVEGIRVTLSELGKARSSAGQQSQGIDDSGLPETIKQLLKMIRELKLQLDQKMAELQALAGDASLTADEKQMRMQALQSEVAMLSSALTGAYANLEKAMRDSQLDPEGVQKALSLVM